MGVLLARSSRTLWGLPSWSHDSPKKTQFLPPCCSKYFRLSQQEDFFGSGTGYSLTVEIRHFKSERKENCFDSWLMERSRSGKSATLKVWADGNPLR